MGTGRTDEFRKDAVRIAPTSGLSRRQVADDLGIGMSTLNKWVTAQRDTDVVSPEDRDFTADRPNQNRRSAKRNGLVISATSGPVRGGCIWRSFSICIRGG